MSNGTPDRDDRKTVRVGSKSGGGNEPDATFIASPETPNTVSGAAAETFIAIDPLADQQQPAKSGPAGSSETPTQPGSDGLTAQTLIGQVRINPGQPDIADPAGFHAAGIEPGTQATFISSEFVEIPAGTTVMRPEPKKDSEDYFDTVTDEVDQKSGKPVRGLVVGDYQVVSELGRGGMGVVYKARHRKLNRLVALKMILSGRHSSNESLERFIAEARAVAKLQHPGIVQIFDIGEHQGLPYFSLEFVEGKDLQKDLNGLPRAPKRCAEMVEQLANAMQYAHDHKILHRDLKPANILLDNDGRPKISDFGLAKVVDDEGSGATSDGTIMGSPSYMPPEQARGQQSAISNRSDVYSLGAILYQMLTARPPFVSERPLDTVMQVINNDPAMPRSLQPDVPADLETICMKSLQKDPSARYASCAELAADLRRYLNGEPILARPISTLERCWRWCRRNPKIAIPSSLAAVSITLTAIIASWAWSETKAQALIIAQERDNVKEERDKVKEQRDEAERQKKIANAERDEAERQRVRANEQTKLAEDNRKAAEVQAVEALKSIQLVVTEIDTKLATQPGSADLRIAILKILEDRWNKIDYQLSGGVKGQAEPTLMAVRMKLAITWTQLGMFDEAAKQYEALVEKARQRIVDQGRTNSARGNLALILKQYAELLRLKLGRVAEAEKVLDEAVTVLRDAVAKPLRPNNEGTPDFEIRYHLATVLRELGNLKVGEGKLSSATQSLQEAAILFLELLRAAEQNGPLVADMKPERVAAFQKLLPWDADSCQALAATMMARQGRVDEALVVWQEAIPRRREVVKARPAETVSLSSLLLTGGRYLIYNGKFDPGTQWLEEAVTVSEGLRASDPKNVDFVQQAAGALYYFGVAKDLQNSPEEALKLFERSRLLRIELAAKPDATAYKAELMLSEARVGNVEATQKLIDELLPLSEKNIDFAMDVARSMAVISLRMEGDAAVSQRTKAIEMLKKVADGGYADSGRLRLEPDYASLRDMPEFQRVVEQMEKNAGGA